MTQDLARGPATLRDLQRELMRYDRLIKQCVDHHTRCELYAKRTWLAALVSSHSAAKGDT
jgi:hypothetical protein